jgi:hypothetical protein
VLPKLIQLLAGWRIAEIEQDVGGVFIAAVDSQDSAGNGSSGI